MKGNKVQQYKIEAVDKLKENIEKSESFLFANYRGLTAVQAAHLRSVLRESGAEFHIVKNRFAKIAFSQLNHKNLESYFSGPTAIAYCGNDAGPIAKAILKLAKEMPIELKGGMVEGKVYDSKGVENLSKLPSRTDLIQMVMRAMLAPLNNAVYALNGVNSRLVRTLDAVRKKKAGGE